MISALRQLGVPRVQFEKHGEVLVIEGAAGQLKAAGDSQVRTTPTATSLTGCLGTDITKRQEMFEQKPVSA